MPRDDSILYTGVSSASSRANAEKRKEMRREKSQERGKLLPVAELINKIIEKEKKDVCDVRSFVISEATPEESIKADLLARKLNLEFIERFHGKINNLLREPREKSNE